MLLVFIRRWGRLFTCCICSTLIRCYWWISILIIIPVVRWCFLIGPHKSAVLLFDRGYPSFGNVDSAIPIDVVGMKSYMDSLFDPTCVPVGVTINKLTLIQIGICPVSLACSETVEVWVGANRMSPSCSFILSRIDLPVSPMYTLPHSHGIL